MPTTNPKYKRATAAATLADTKPDDLLASRWSNSGAIWRVVALFPAESSFEQHRVALASTSSTRRRIAQIRDMCHVEVVTA